MLFTLSYVVQQIATLGACMNARLHAAGEAAHPL